MTWRVSDVVLEVLDESAVDAHRQRPQALSVGSDTLRDEDAIQLKQFTERLRQNPKNSRPVVAAVCLARISRVRWGTTASE